jgi:NAD(P)-dependent dehydrogenase (short-subunit alcohol dehydrogenase family)
MKVAGSTALVTGANRGLGLAFAKVLVEREAAKVYAAARNPEAVTLMGVVPMKLDVTSDEDAVAAACVAGNINLLINNAGIARPGGFLADGAVEAAREQFEVNFVGPLRMARAFAPVLAKNGGGAIINVLSVASCERSDAGDLWRVEISRMGADQRPSHRTCATGHPGRRAACSLHRHRPCTRFRRAEEFARGNRADDARRPRTRGR